MGSPLQGSALRVAKVAPPTALGADLKAEANLSALIVSGSPRPPPVDRKRPGLLDRIEVLIELKVGLAVMIYQAVTPWLAAVHRGRGCYWF